MAEVAELSFAGAPPDIAVLSRRWRAMLDTAHRIVAELPPAEVGKCVLTSGGELCRLAPGDLAPALRRREVHFHAGHIGGVLPRLHTD